MHRVAQKSSPFIGHSAVDLSVALTHKKKAAKARERLVFTCGEAGRSIVMLDVVLILFVVVFWGPHLGLTTCFSKEVRSERCVQQAC